MRYGPTRESSIGADQRSRSARLTTVRARSNAADTRLDPGTTKSVGMSMRSMNWSIRSPRASTMAPVTSVEPGVSLARLAGSVATSAIST